METRLSSGSRIQLDCLATRHLPKSTLHVQSVSYWAAANIGPYAQSSFIPENIYCIAGQIGLEPHTMVLPDGIRAQVRTSLSNLHAVCKSVQTEPLGCICYLVDRKDLEFVRGAWSGSSPLLRIGVPRLPRDALVEWQVIGYPTTKNGSYELLQGKCKLICVMETNVLLSCNSCSLICRW